MKENLRNVVEKPVSALRLEMHNGIALVVKSRSDSEENSDPPRLSIMLNLLKAEAIILMAIFGCVILSLTLPLVAVLAIAKPRDRKRNECI